MKFRRMGNQMWDISRIPPGLQLWTIRKVMEKDPLGTFKKVAEMGYKTVEIPRLEFVGLEGIPAAEVKIAAENSGLLIPSFQSDLELLENDLEGLILYTKTLGAKYIVVSYVPRERLVDETKLVEVIVSLNRIGKEARKQGLQLLYHNHDNEFEQINKKTIMEIIFENVPYEYMQAELDLGWVYKGGSNPMKTLLSFKGRVPIIHVKDVDKEGNFTEVGQGVIDYASILKLAPSLGVKYYYVEQDDPTDPMKSAQQSLAYLKSIGIA